MSLEEVITRWLSDFDLGFLPNNYFKCYRIIRLMALSLFFNLKIIDATTSDSLNCYKSSLSYCVQKCSGN